MKLHNLRPAKGATTQRENVLVVVKHPVKVVHLQKVTKVVKAALVIKAKWHTKVVRCQFNVVFQNVVLRIINRIEYKVFNLGQVDAMAEKYGITEFSLENLYING